MSASQSPQATTPQTTARRSLKRLVAISLAVIIVLYLGIGFLVVPRVVKSQLIQFVEAEFGVTPRIEVVRFDPFDLRLALDGVELPDPQGGLPIVSFESLAVDLRIFGFLTSDVALEEVSWVGPQISLVVGPSGLLNVQELLAAREARMPTLEEVVEAESESAAPFILDIGDLRIERGSVRFEDQAKVPAFEAHLVPVDLHIENFTTRAHAESPGSLVVRLGDETEFRWTGQLSLDPIRSSGQLALTDLDLRVPWDYLSEQVRFEIARGGLDVAVDYQFEMDDGFELGLTRGKLAVRELEIIDPALASSVLSLPSLHVSDVAVDVNQAGLSLLHISAVTLEGGRLGSHLEPDGRLHLVELFATPSADTSDSSGSSGSSGSSDSSGSSGSSGGPDAAGEVESEVATPSTEGSPPEVRIDRVAVKGFDLDFEDRGPSRAVPIRLSPLDLVVTDYASTPGSTLRVELASGFGEKGKLSVKGPVALEPLLVELAIEASAIELATFEPYVEDVARIDLAGGSVSARLDVVVKDEVAEDVVAKDAERPPPNVAVRGRIQLDEFVSLDRRFARKFVEWKRLRVEGLEYSPAGIRVEEVALSGAQAHVLRDPQGEMNVTAIFAGDEDDARDSGANRVGGAEETSATDRPLAIEVAKVSLEGLGADFEDQAADPDFSFVLDSLSGTIEGLSSQKQSSARIDLSGRLDKAAPIRISGEIDPLSIDGYSDVKVEVKRVPLPVFSPYSRRYVGYQIGKGQLELDLHYRLNDGHLVSTNHVALNEFGFGERVESEEATSLPVSLAVELLRNSKGNIVVELPIEGNVDDPSFSFFGLLGKTVVNLVTRVATSPLSVVAGLVGVSGDELAQIEFEPGSTVLSDLESSQLEAVATVLVERPALRLGIMGRADPEVDGPALRASRIDAEVRQSAFESMSRRAQEQAGAASSLELSPREHLDGLEKLYRERMGGKLEEVEPPSSASSEERTRMMIEAATQALARRMELVDEDWRELARSRAEAVESALLATAELTSDRLFRVEVEVGPVAEGGAVSAALSMTAN